MMHERSETFLPCDKPPIEVVQANVVVIMVPDFPQMECVFRVEDREYFVADPGAGERNCGLMEFRVIRAAERFDRDGIRAEDEVAPYCVSELARKAGEEVGRHFQGGLHCPLVMVKSSSKQIR
jgi:hypothetical protein